MQRIYLTMLFLAVSLSCSKEDLALDSQPVKARVLYRSCAGTVVQWVDAPASKGQDWLWATNPNMPINQMSPSMVYTNCVSAFDIPMDRQVLNDTLEFTYKELSGPSVPVCTIGGLPTIYISVKGLKSK